MEEFAKLVNVASLKGGFNEPPNVFDLMETSDYGLVISSRCLILKRQDF